MPARAAFVDLRVMLAAGAAALAAPVAASAFDATVWERDATLIEKGVLAPVDDEFLRSKGVETWQEYHAAFRAGLQRFDTVVDQRSYQILEEVARQMQDDFETFPEEERWQDASYYIRTKLVLTSFILKISNP